MGKHQSATWWHVNTSLCFVDARMVVAWILHSSSANLSASASLLYMYKPCRPCFGIGQEETSGLREVSMRNRHYRSVDAGSMKMLWALSNTHWDGDCTTSPASEVGISEFVYVLTIDSQDAAAYTKRSKIRWTLSRQVSRRQSQDNSIQLMDPTGYSARSRKIIDPMVRVLFRA